MEPGGAFPECALRQEVERRRRCVPVQRSARHDPVLTRGTLYVATTPHYPVVFRALVLSPGDLGDVSSKGL